MSIFAIIGEALRIGRAHKSLWLFGFLVALGGGGLNFGVLDAEQAPQPPVAAAPPDVAAVVAVLGVGLAALIAFVILEFLSTGALIEGVKRARRSGSMKLGEGFREGWAHWGVLFRIALLFIVAIFSSIAVLAGACVLVWLTLGAPAVYFACALAIVIGVPWLLTLYMWQAFAERIAVLENRRAMDAIRKARLFLHGRVPLGLKLLVAGFLGVLFVTAIGIVVIAPITAIVVKSASLWGNLGALGLGALTLLPAAFVVLAMIGIVTSSVWTIGYLSQVEQ
ncbi:MAG TPA: hypothetical protein VFX89_14340 [Gammaproteobacteria bacterium]|nr:hypothetical protein [Gammaproteobacteria bacterium]